MQNFNDLIEKSLEKLKDFDPENIIQNLAVNPYLLVSVGAGDIRDKTRVANYCFFPGFIDLLKPKQIIELGSAMGVGSVAMLTSSYKDFHFYGVTLRERGLEFCYVDSSRYPNFHPIIGDYLDMSIWPKDLDLSQTDLWYIDGEHSEAHVRATLELYKPFFKPGATILMDDCSLNPGMQNVYDDLENIFPVKSKVLNYQLHWSGWGIIEVGDKND